MQPSIDFRYEFNDRISNNYRLEPILKLILQKLRPANRRLRNFSRREQQEEFAMEPNDMLLYDDSNYLLRRPKSEQQMQEMNKLEDIASGQKSVRNIQPASMRLPFRFG